MKKAEIHKFKKGQIVTLDEIYDIQGLGEDWWEAADPADNAGDRGETVAILKDITIKIMILTREP